MRKKLDISKKLKEIFEANKERTKEKRPSSIKNLAIPASKLKELLSIKITCDPTENEKVAQTLSLKKNHKIEAKWVVFRDPDMHEFSKLKERGITLIKEDPPIYGIKLKEGIILASHKGNYTFTMGSYDIKVEDLKRFFEIGLNHAKV